jgi:phosphoserine aminotransferase
MSNAKPAVRPANPHFSSGPCAKPPGWSADWLSGALLGRSHRSAEGKARLKRAIDLTRDVLQVPDSHLVGIVPAPTPARSSWRCGRCWASAASTCWPGRASARAG